MAGERPRARFCLGDGGKLSRRTDCTYRPNMAAGRHGWLRLTPAYSVGVVDGLLHGRGPMRVLDPFCGTSTTALCASYRG